MKSLAPIGLFVAILAASTVGIAAQSATPAALAARVQTLEDRDAIRALLVDYATTLDNRDFEGFAQLWARDAEFSGGAGNTARGPAAIAELLKTLLGRNGAGKGLDFHLVMNQTVSVTGDTATGFSRGTWVNTSDKRLQVAIIANYYDQFVRENGRWKFKRHQIGGEPPATHRATR